MVIEEAILEALENIKENRKDGNGFDRGICGLVETHIYFNNRAFYSPMNIHMHLKDAWIFWKHYSGNVAYPVPDDKSDPHDAFIYYTNNKWDTSTYYGTKRRELLDYLITWFKEKKYENS